MSSDPNNARTSLQELIDREDSVMKALCHILLIGRDKYNTYLLITIYTTYIHLTANINIYLLKIMSVFPAIPYLNDADF